MSWRIAGEEVLTTRTPWLSYWLLAFLLLSARAATAQEKGQTGLTMGYPAAVGVIWHLTDRLALRPEVSLSMSSTDYSNAHTVGSESWAVGVGLSALFYVHKWDSLSAYVSPRYTYSRARTTPVVSGTSASASNSWNHAIVGAFGAQCAINPRFSAFGEVGLGFSSASTDYGLTNPSYTTHSWGTRTGAGVVFYF